MSRKAVVLSPLSELYKTAFDSCLALWPLLFIRVGFLFFDLLMIVTFLFIGFWPILHTLFDHFDDLSSGRFTDVFQSMDLTSYFTNPHILILTGLLIAFYITVIYFFLSFFDAALYSQLSRNQKKGESFSITRFFSEGFKYTLPMMGLQAAWFSLFLAIIVGVGLIVVLAVLISHIFLVLGILLAFPLGLLAILGMIGLWVAAMLSGAYLVEGYSIQESIRLSMMRVLAHKGRTMGAVCMITLIYFVFYLAFNGVFAVFGMIPLIGILFTGFKIAVNAVLTIGLNIYMTSLAVALQLESKD